MQYHASADSSSGRGVDPSDDLEHGQQLSLHPLATKATHVTTLSVKPASDSTNRSPGTYRLHHLHELDAFAAVHIAEESPRSYWEDSHARFRFETLNEALEAMRDPLIQGFLPPQQVATTVIEEIREFPPYSACFQTSWRLVEKLAYLPFSLNRQADLWTARFGSFHSPESKSAPIAICLAALKVKGFELHLPGFT